MYDEDREIFFSRKHSLCVLQLCTTSILTKKRLLIGSITLVVDYGSLNIGWFPLKNETRKYIDEEWSGIASENQNMSKSL